MKHGPPVVCLETTPAFRCPLLSNPGASGVMRCCLDGRVGRREYRPLGARLCCAWSAGDAIIIIIINDCCYGRLLLQGPARTVRDCFQCTYARISFVACLTQGSLTYGYLAPVSLLSLRFACCFAVQQPISERTPGWLGFVDTAFAARLMRATHRPSGMARPMQGTFTSSSSPPARCPSWSALFGPSRNVRPDA